MAVWAISDLHLSLARPDRRERHAARWREHVEAIERHWREQVGRDDLVLLPGDLSMARNHGMVQPDLHWLSRLPGIKVLAPGNHDRWWNSLDAVRAMMRRSLRVVDGDAIVEGGAVLCGAAGAPVAERDDRSPAVDRALARAEAMLAAAAGLRGPGMPLYVLWHYPPFGRDGRPGPWIPLFEAAGATAVVYGHLHAESQWSAAVQGVVGGVRYHCVAADAVGFRPLRIDRLNPPSGGVAAMPAPP